MCIHTNVLGQLMLDRINNLKGASTVTVKRCGRGNADTKILKHPAKPDELPNRSRQNMKLSLNTRAGDSSLFLGLPDNQRRTKKDTVAKN